MKTFGSKSGLSAAAVAGVLCVLSAPAAAEGVTLDFTGAENAERISATYRCPDREPFAVEYINAGPNSLAIVPIEGERLLFVAALAASGVKYVSGPYSWWTKGNEATLANEMQSDSDPVTCTEVEG